VVGQLVAEETACLKNPQVQLGSERKMSVFGVSEKNGQQDAVIHTDMSGPIAQWGARR
jgi:hypothetical protein